MLRREVTCSTTSTLLSNSRCKVGSLVGYTVQRVLHRIQGLKQQKIAYGYSNLNVLNNVDLLEVNN